MKIFGLTGGIGSGKSVVAHMLREEDVPVIDADGIGHGLLESDPRIQKAVIEAFGSEIIEHGALSREKLASLVFSDNEARARLNTILHPAIIHAIRETCETLAGQGHPVVVVEAALVGEGSSREPWLSGLILVLAETETRIERLVAFRKMAEEDARRRIAAQTDPALKMLMADWIIYNDGDLNMLREQVSALAAHLRDPGSGQDKGFDKKPR